MAEAVETDSAYALEVRAEKLRVFAGQEWKRRGHTDTVAVGGGGISDRVAGHESLDIGGSLTEETRWGRTSVLSGYNTRVDGSLKVHCHQDTALLGGGIRESHLGAEAVVSVMSDDMIIGAGNRTTAMVDLLVTSLIGADDVGGTVHSDLVLLEVAGVFYDREYISSTHNVSGSVTWTGTLCATNATTFKQYFKATRGLHNTVNGVMAPPAKEPPKAADGTGALAVVGGLAQSGARGGQSTASNLDGNGQVINGVMQGDDFKDVKATENLEESQHVNGGVRLQQVQNMGETQNVDELAAANNVDEVAATNNLNVVTDPSTGENIYDEVAATNNVTVDPSTGENIYDTVAPDVYSSPTEGEPVYATLEEPVYAEVIPRAQPEDSQEIATIYDHLLPREETIYDHLLPKEEMLADPSNGEGLYDFIPGQQVQVEGEEVFNKLDRRIEGWATPGQQPVEVDEGIYSRLELDVGGELGPDGGHEYLDEGFLSRMGGEELYQSSEGLSPVVNNLDETAVVASNSDGAVTVTKSVGDMQEAGNGDLYATVKVTDTNGVVQIREGDTVFDIDLTSVLNSSSVDETTNAGPIDNTAASWSNKTSGYAEVPAPRTEGANEFGPTPATTAGDGGATQVGGDAKSLSAADQRRAEVQAALDAGQINQAQFDNEMAMIDFDYRNLGPDGGHEFLFESGGGGGGIYAGADDLADTAAVRPPAELPPADGGTGLAGNVKLDPTYASADDLADTAAVRPPAELPPADGGTGLVDNVNPYRTVQLDGTGQEESWRNIYITANEEGRAMRPGGVAKEMDTSQFIPAEGPETIWLQKTDDGIFRLDAWQTDQLVNNDATVMMPGDGFYPTAVKFDYLEDLGDGLFRFDDQWRTKGTIQLNFEWDVLPNAEDMSEWMSQRLYNLASQGDEGAKGSSVDDVVSTVAGSDELAQAQAQAQVMTEVQSTAPPAIDPAEAQTLAESLATQADELLDVSEESYKSSYYVSSGSGAPVRVDPFRYDEGLAQGNALDYVAMQLHKASDALSEGADPRAGVLKGQDRIQRWRHLDETSKKAFGSILEGVMQQLDDLYAAQDAATQVDDIAVAGSSTDDVAQVSDTATVVADSQDLVSSSDKVDEVNALLNNTSSMKGSTDATPTPSAQVNGGGGEVPAGLEQHFNSSVGGESNGLGSADLNAPGNVEVPQGEVVDAPPASNAGAEGDRAVVLEGMEAHSNTGEVQNSEIQFVEGTDAVNGADALSGADDAEEVGWEWMNGQMRYNTKKKEIVPGFSEVDPIFGDSFDLDTLFSRDLTSEFRSGTGPLPERPLGPGHTQPDPNLFDVVGTLDDVAANTNDVDDVSTALTNADGLNTPEAARDLDAVGTKSFDNAGAATNGDDVLEFQDDWFAADNDYRVTDTNGKTTTYDSGGVPITGGNAGDDVLEFHDDWFSADDSYRWSGTDGDTWEISSSWEAAPGSPEWPVKDSHQVTSLQEQTAYLKGDMALDQSYLDNLMASRAYQAGDENTLELAMYLEASGEAKQLALNELEAGRDPTILLRQKLEQLTVSRGAVDPEVVAYTDTLKLMEDPAALSVPPSVDEVETTLDMWRVRAQDVQAKAGEQDTIERASWWSQMSNKMDAAANQASIGQDPRLDLWEFGRDLEVHAWRDGGTGEDESTMIYTLIKEYDALFANQPPFKPPVYS